MDGKVAKRRKSLTPWERNGSRENWTESPINGMNWNQPVQLCKGNADKMYGRWVAFSLNRAPGTICKLQSCEQPRKQESRCSKFAHVWQCKIIIYLYINLGFSLVTSMCTARAQAYIMCIYTVPPATAINTIYSRNSGERFSFGLSARSVIWLEPHVLGVASLWVKRRWRQFVLAALSNLRQILACALLPVLLICAWHAEWDGNELEFVCVWMRGELAAFHLRVCH